MTTLQHREETGSTDKRQTNTKISRKTKRKSANRLPRRRTRTVPTNHLIESRKGKVELREESQMDRRNRRGNTTIGQRIGRNGRTSRRKRLNQRIRSNGRPRETDTTKALATVTTINHVGRGDTIHKSHTTVEAAVPVLPTVTQEFILNSTKALGHRNKIARGIEMGRKDRRGPRRKR